MEEGATGRTAAAVCACAGVLPPPSFTLDSMLHVFEQTGLMGPAPVLQCSTQPLVLVASTLLRLPTMLLLVLLLLLLLLLLLHLVDTSHAVPQLMTQQLQPAPAALPPRECSDSTRHASAGAAAATPSDDLANSNVTRAQRA